MTDFIYSSMAVVLIIFMLVVGAFMFNEISYIKKVNEIRLKCIQENLNDTIKCIGIR